MMPRDAGRPRELAQGAAAAGAGGAGPGAVFTLMESRYAKPALPVFMVAAGVHLGLMQEQALQDPRQTNPEQSSYAKTVMFNAREYGEHAKRTFEAVKRQRESFVIVKYDPVVEDDPLTSNIRVFHRYHWYDKLTEAEGRRWVEYKNQDKKFHDGSEEAEVDRKRHVEDVIRKLTMDLDDPKGTYDQWLELTTKPIPSQRKAQALQ